MWPCPRATGATPRCRSTTRTEAITFTGRVSAREAGWRLDDYLAQHVPATCGPVSRATIRRAIVAGAVTVERLCVRRPAWALQAGSRVVARVEAARIDPHRVERRTAAQPLHVVFEDDWLLVVDKPPGLPTHATADPQRPHLVQMVKEYLRRSSRPVDALGVHQRLDRETSGLVLFTTQADANRGIAEQFAARTVQKVYLALVARPSRLPPRAWSVDAPVFSGGTPRHAHTAFRVLKETGDLLLIEARPRTGRKHQIRIHLADAGLPIVGDGRYGWRAAPVARTAAVRTAPRVMLHAGALTLRHPVTGQRLALECAMPADFAERLSATAFRRRRS